MLGVAWIQFMVHDWVVHENDPTESFKVPLALGDPLRLTSLTDIMSVSKTKLDETQLGDLLLAKPYRNKVTHWWDASQIYGSDLETANSLRSWTGGKLKVTEDGLLPLNVEGYDKTGFEENYWVGLSIMHTLFVLEHNEGIHLLS